MNQPGHRPQPTATTAGQPHPTDRTELLKLAGEVDDALAQAIAEETQRRQQTAIRVTDPDIPSWRDGARIGTTPPVTNQPGSRRPAMSQRAVDLNTTILSTSVVIASIGGAATGILWASHYANPTVIQWICGCAVAVPAAFAVAALAFKGLMKSAKQVVEAAPPTINQHYRGTVHQDNRQQHLHTRTTGVIAYTRNQPELPANSGHAPW